MSDNTHTVDVRPVRISVLMDEMQTAGWQTERQAEAGGARRDRTDDLMLAKHALSQLSYGPLANGKLSRSEPTKVGGPGKI